jgi:hypothetical protein
MRVHNGAEQSNGTSSWLLSEVDQPMIQGMIPKSGNRFSEKIMPSQEWADKLVTIPYSRIKQKRCQAGGLQKVRRSRQNEAGRVA